MTSAHPLQALRLWHVTILTIAKLSPDIRRHLVFEGRAAGLNYKLAAWMFASAPDLNRSVAFVRVLEPFAAWARLDPNFSDVTVESLNEEGTAYLLPDVLMAGDEEKLFRKYWRDIFDHELYAWSTDEREWPKRRTYAMFRKWFSIDFSSLCYDLVEAPVEDDGG